MLGTGVLRAHGRTLTEFYFTLSQLRLGGASTEGSSINLIAIGLPTHLVTEQTRENKSIRVR